MRVVSNRIQLNEKRGPFPHNRRRLTGDIGIFIVIVVFDSVITGATIRIYRKGT